MLRQDADFIIEKSIAAVLPDAAVERALGGKDFGSGNIYLVAIGKAAWQMAFAAHRIMGGRIHRGIVLTKYGHVKGSIADYQLFEAGHPVPDENSFKGTEKVLEMVSGLSPSDTVLFLISGGGSALFEKPLCTAKELENLTKELLSSGADITEINTIRKRMSAVKGGKFAQLCSPARIYSIVLSDIVGDPLDMIASGPAFPDSSTAADALAIARKYNLTLTGNMEELLRQETPKELSNVDTVINGSVRELCSAAEAAAKELGYECRVLTDSLCCEARDAGDMLAKLAKEHQASDKSLAFIAGGETVVHLKGTGKGGRNQEIALSAALGISGLKETAVFSVGSDGTDGPTDAAGGFADQDTVSERGLTYDEARTFLDNNDAYHALQRTGGLIITGPTGTNVNDVAVLLIKR